MSKPSGGLALDAQLIQARVKLQRAIHDENGLRTAMLVCHGAYEVRLIESLYASPANAFLFWIELFDHNRRLSIDSAGSDALEDAVLAAEHLIARAKEQSEDPGMLPK